MDTPVTSWNEYPHVDDVHHLDNGDLACIDEIRQVLSRHGKLDRFGVNLLHRHFPITENEVLVETCDEMTRTLTIRPEQRGGVANALQTSWQLTPMGPGPIMYCNAVCRGDGKGGHVGDHAYTR
jgi:hypothetical protein